MSKNGSQAQPISLEALKAGDRAEFARFVEKNSPIIYRLALRMLGNEQDAEDVLQETFIKAFQHIQSFDGRAKVSTWLYRIATNEALMHLRKRKPEALSVEQPGSSDEDDLQEPLQITDWSQVPEEELLSGETLVYLQEAIEQLPDTLRLTFVLRELEGLSTQETAQVLGIREGAVKTRLSRARLQLREILSAYFEERIEGKAYGT
ncbi:MAG: RNA polymerase sigma factor [Anaerolineales bacterium]|jgi:RNA polymerase sigma-70 factor (ECF subfamily)